MTVSYGPILIACLDSKGGIGKDNAMPWRVPEEMRHFRETTSGHVVVMGRKTFESLGRPLPNRINIVVTRQHNWWPYSQLRDDLYVASSLQQAMDMGQVRHDMRTFIIGGAELYRCAFPFVEELIVSQLKEDYGCDTFFPPIPPEFEVTSVRTKHSEALASGIFSISHWVRNSCIPHHPV